MAKRSKRKQKGDGKGPSKRTSAPGQHTPPGEESATDQTADQSVEEPRPGDDDEDAGRSADVSEDVDATTAEADSSAQDETASDADRDAIAPPLTCPPRVDAGLTAFWHHLHPPRARIRSARLGATIGLGLATLVSLAIATASGILLMFYYVPSIERAHASVQDLIALVPMGRFLRDLHRWSAHASVLFCVLHMVRTMLWGSYRAGHARVWLVGVGLLLTVIATSFSGYLLPWDQDSYWTVTVGTSLAGYVPGLGDGLRRFLMGGNEVGQTTLTRFFMLHVMLLPSLGLVLLVLHLFRLRRAGGLARPSSASGPGEQLVPSAPWLTSRELALSLLLTIGLVLLAVLTHAGLGPPPDLVRPDNPPKAPWFLVGFQEMVGYSAVVGGFVFPALLLLTLSLGPWIDGGRSCDGALLPGRGPRLAVLAATAAAAGVVIPAVLWWGGARQGSASWVNPATIGALTVIGVALLTWGVSRSRSLAYRALVVGLLTVLAVFTVFGWYWRGPNWSLTYHPGPGANLTRPAGGARTGAP